MQDTNIIVTIFVYTLKCDCVYVYIHTHTQRINLTSVNGLTILGFSPFFCFFALLKKKKKCGSFSEFKNGPHFAEIQIQHINAVQLYYNYEIILHQTIV